MAKGGVEVKLAEYLCQASEFTATVDTTAEGYQRLTLTPPEGEAKAFTVHGTVVVEEDSDG